MVNYKELRFGNLTSPKFRHLLLLIYWPFYGAMFWLLERGLTLTYKAVEIPLDSKIPFCEFFVFPYYFWFVFLTGILAYTLFFDVPAFKKYMYFIMITYTVTCIIYIVYPNKQELRPTEFARDNFCVDIVKYLYSFDTNTNVCPSLHVIGSFAVMFTALSCERFKTPVWRTFYIASTVLISISTVFLKQHSVLDIFVALVVCFAAYPFAFILPERVKKKSLPATEKSPEKEAVYSGQ